MYKTHHNNRALPGLFVITLLAASLTWLLSVINSESPENASVFSGVADQQSRQHDSSPSTEQKLQLKNVVSGVTVNTSGVIQAENSAESSAGARDETSPVRLQMETLIYANEFDQQFERWEGDKDIWQMGAPVAGPENLCADDSMCIGTVLDDEYPDFRNAELKSPAFDLPEIAIDESIELNASNWVEIDLNDQAEILLSYFDGEFWVDPEIQFVQSGHSPGWRPIRLDLSKYAGNRVRLHFKLKQDEKLAGNGNGWYIDDLRLIRKLESQPRGKS